MPCRPPDDGENPRRHRLCVVERGDDHLTIHVRTASTNLLRVAIPAFPGWHAYLSGVELPTLNVDLAFQGVLVPAGEGDIRLAYTPRWFWLGALISALALLTCASVLVRALFKRRADKTTEGRSAAQLPRG